MKTIIYVDGFNLYYRALKKNPQHKWLNLLELAKQVLIPTNVIAKVKYFTAYSSGRWDPSTPIRQHSYLEALGTVPEIETFYGNFLVKKAYAPLWQPQGKPLFQPWPSVVRIIKTEEKGSDVNLASHLILDACKGAFDVAVVVSNDTDLVEPIRMAREELGKIVGVICPDSAVASDLQKVASFVRFVRPGHLAKAQFPNTIPRAGEPDIIRPVEWV